MFFVAKWLESLWSSAVCARVGPGLVGVSLWVPSKIFFGGTHRDHAYRVWAHLGGSCGVLWTFWLFGDEECDIFLCGSAGIGRLRFVA